MPQSTLGLYGGLTGDERRARRVEQLLDAALELFGEVGYADTTIRAICRAASLNERYFYESFKTREDLLFAVYERVVGELTAVVFAEVADAAATAPDDLEVIARAGLGSFFTYLTADVHRARLLSLEVVGVSPRLERRRRDTMHAFAAFIVQEALVPLAADRAPRLDPQLTARSLVGATNELLIDWLVGDLAADAGDLIDHCVALFVATGRAIYA